MDQPARKTSLLLSLIGLDPAGLPLKSDTRTVTAYTLNDSILPQQPERSLGAVHGESYHLAADRP